MCRSIAAFGKLEAIPSGASIVVASDEPRVRAAARADRRVHSVVFLEKAETLFDVAPDVLRTLDVIDSWLTLSPPPRGVEVETLRWTRSVEGGLTGQRIQDALLLIRSYRDLLATTGATDVYVAAEPHARWLDRVMRACAAAAGAQFHELRMRPFAHAAQALASFLRPFAISAYQLINVVRYGGGRIRRRSSSTELDRAIVFLLASSWPKHVQNVVPLMAALRSRGAAAVALCWSASERYTARPADLQLAEAGLACVRLESAVSLRDVVESYVAAALVAWRAFRERRYLDRLIYEGVPLGAILAESARYFIVAELPQRIRIERAMRSILGDARPRAFKPWGPEFFEGRTALRCLPDRARTLIFHYWVGAGLEWPYADAQKMIDFFLAKGPDEVAIASRAYSLPPAKIRLVGHGRFDTLSKFATQTPAEESRRRLHLPENARRYVGLDPNAALRGFQSMREQIELVEAVLHVAAAHPDLLVVVKPHPAHGIQHLQPLFHERRLANVVVLSRDESVLDFLNAVDVLVTKISTLLLEAALMDRVAISTLFSGERYFDIYAGLSTVVNSTTELETLLSILLDDSRYPAWRNDRLARQRRALPNYYVRSSRSAADAAADALLEAITSHHCEVPPESSAGRNPVTCSPPLGRL
jgi:hypothetical protein